MDDYSVLPELQALVGYQIVANPHFGVLKLGDRLLRPGDRFTQEDLTQGRLQFIQTTNLPYGVASQPDGFDFVLYKRNHLVTSDSLFSECMPERDIPLPDDGVYTFPIMIMATPTPTGFAKPITVEERGSRILTEADLFVSSSGSASEKLLYSVKVAPKNGTIFVRNRPVVQFTQQDVAQGYVRYQHTGSTPDADGVTLMCCNPFSKCVTVSMPIQLNPAIKLTGHNVFYAKIATKWNVMLEANKSPALFTLIDGNTQGPPLSTSPSGYVVWSYYDSSYQGAEDIPARGAGYDKPAEFRNIPLTYQWEGGLPLGVYMENLNGLLATASRLPYNVDTNTVWSLPSSPNEFQWQVRATDPYTGETDERTYYLRVTETGFGPDGQSSEIK